MKRTRIAAGLFLATFLVLPTCVSAQEAEEKPEQTTESSSADMQTSVDRETFYYPSGGSTPRPVRAALGRR